MGSMRNKVNVGGKKEIFWKEVAAGGIVLLTYFTTF